MKRLPFSFLILFVTIGLFTTMYVYGKKQTAEQQATNPIIQQSNQQIQIQSNSYNQYNNRVEDVEFGRDTSFQINIENLTIQSPYSFDNLTVFPITAKSTLDKKTYITLSEAMEKEYVKVYETSDVQNLNIKNLSDSYIFIHSGDVVKGGKQDRTLRYDVIVPPNSGKIDIASFCVESGRWNARGDEADGAFATSEMMLSTKSLKIAAKKEKDQGKVWSEVSEQQEKINANGKTYYGLPESYDVKNVASQSSLQLALENKELAKIKEDYLAAFIDFQMHSTDIIGFAYAINNELYGIDIYNNKQLFKDLWEKQINSIVVEAISEKTDSISLAPIRQGDIYRYINIQEQEQKLEDINAITKFVTAECDIEDLYIFTSFDVEENNWLHRNFILE